MVYSPIMKRTKLILVILALLLLSGGIYFGFRLAPKTPPETAGGMLDRSWGVFQSYAAAAKANDLNTLSKLVYKLGPICQDTSKRDECNQIMNGVYVIAGEWKEEDFKNIWWDKKQIILFTDWVKIENEIEGTSMAGYQRREIYFTRDSAGHPKILYISLPVNGVYTFKIGSASSTEARLQTLIADNDQDGVDNELEECMGTTQGCVKTDPNKRDSNGNGWWDGVERYMTGSTSIRKPPVPAASSTDLLTKPFGDSLSLPL
jgi:hypothetical protein